eukprot:CAMPEP_0115435798 /NCGR_PEP_ID=MMETSP0271-20121206/33851_1 /TAXON_ID=71861 /ORGANISM="Scrippsiella trochoidea, Strain CCMP3099" /LENGTH=118 /DNA_ID=CAMNT_0002861279 /DNA_START=1645 /DNA_END=2002 /DNA_ORIENTATION=+
MTSISIPVHLQLTSFGTSSSKVFCHDEAINETCITNNVTVENGASTLGPNWRPELLLVMVTGSLVLNITNVEPSSSPCPPGRMSRSSNVTSPPVVRTTTLHCPSSEGTALLAMYSNSV